MSNVVININDIDKFDCVILKLIMFFPSSSWQVHHLGSSTIVISSGVELDNILKMRRI